MARFAREHGLVGNALYREVDDFSLTYTAAYNRTSSASPLHTATGPGTSLHEAACRPLVQHLVPYNQLAQFVEAFWRIFGEFAREVVEARFSSASGASGEVRLAELEAATWFRSLVWGPADGNLLPDATDQEEEDASVTTLSERPPAGVVDRPSSLQTVLASLLAEMTAVLTRGQNRALQSKIEAILDREETFLRDEFSPWYVAHSQSPAPEDGGALSDSEVIVRKDKNSLRCRLSLGKVPCLTDVAVATTAADPTGMRGGDQVEQSPVLSNTPPAHWLDATLVQEVGDGGSTRTLQQGTPYADGHRSARFFEAEVLPQLGGRLSESERDLLQGVQTEILQHVYPEDCNKYATAEVSSVATELAFVARRPARQSTWRGFFSLFPEGGEELAVGEGYEPPAGFTFSVQRSWGDGRGGQGEAETVEEKVSLHLLSDRAALPSLAAAPADRETPLRLPIRQLEYIVSTLPPLVFDAFRFLALVLKRAQVLKPVAGDATDGAEVEGTTTSRGTAHGHDFRLLRDQNFHHIVEFHHMDSDEQHPQLPYTPGENDLVGAEELVALFCLNLEYTTSGNRWRLDLLRTKTLGSLLSKCLWNAEWYLKSVGQDVGPVRYQLLMTAADGNYNANFAAQEDMLADGALVPECSFFFQPVPAETARGSFFSGAATHGGWETFVGRNRARVLQNLRNLQMALEKRPKDVAAFLEMALLQS
eukprot:g14737.t1